MIGVFIFSLWTAVAIVGLYGMKEEEEDNRCEN